MGGKNNTTPLGPIGDGTVGTSRMSSSAGNAIGQEISRINLDYQLKNNASIKGVFEATYQMCNRWMNQDKIRIISEYGAEDQLKKGMSNEALSKLCAKVLVASLPKEELKRIIGEEKYNESKLVKDVRQINKRKLITAKQYFTLNNYKDFYNQTGQFAKNDKDLLKRLKKAMDFPVDVKTKKELPKLRNELTRILKTQTNLELSMIATRLDIEFEDHTAAAIIIKRICNLVNSYVTLILGKDKGVSPSRFAPAVVDEIERLLLLTSYGYVTGQVGIGDAELYARQQAAKNAKKLQNASLKNYQAEHFSFATTRFGKNKGQLKLKRTVDFQGNESFSAKMRKFQLNKNKLGSLRGSKSVTNSGVLDGLSKQQLYQIAANLNIPNYDLMDDDQLKYVIAQMAGSELRGYNRDFNRAMKIQNPQKRAEELKKLELRKKNLIVTSADRMTSQGTQDFSSQIPVVSFNAEGRIASSAILKAVPVYIVGTASKVGRLQSESDAAKARDIRTATADALLKDFNGDAARRALLRTLGDESFLTVKNARKNRGIRKKLKENPDSVLGYNTSPNTAGLAVQAVTGMPLISAGALSDAEAFSDELARTTADRKAVHPLSSYKNWISSTAYNIFAKGGSNVATFGHVMPVFDVNKSNDYQKDIFNLVSNISTQVNNLPTLFAALQSGGTSVNMASAGSALAIASNAISSGMTQAGNRIGMATGGSMKAKTSRVSSIITGDHPQNKNNTELVSVDWNNQKINVKPIPKMATGGEVANNSNVQNVQRLTKGQRNVPMAVGISSGIVSYSKALSDVTDDGSRTAVKVYSINGGIHEKIHVGDSDLSLFDAVYGVFSAVTNLSAQIETSNKILTTISANTAATNSKIENISTNNTTTGFEFPVGYESFLAGE